MDKELIQRLVAESGLAVADWQLGQTISTKPEIQRLVALVAEECAKVCDQRAWSHPSTPMLGPELNAKACAAAIRERFCPALAPAPK